MVNEPDSNSLRESEPVGTGGAAVSPVTVAKRRSGFRWVVEVVVIVAAAFILALLIQQFLVKPYAIPSPSMEPTLVEGDRVLVSRVTYNVRDPERGDIIVFEPPGYEGSDPFIKRVVAVGGDTVAVRDGVLWVNGVAQDEPYLKEGRIWEDFPETSIAPGWVWAMGDNRNNSGDSRVFGPVSEEAIIGVAFAIYWPLGDLGGL
ncbi:MAG: signal peptidase I [Actinobacteria bacterium]|mgnify:CR=1 FL=1|nr:signal peptidase I [Actinomycetota bacterium]